MADETLINLSDAPTTVVSFSTMVVSGSFADDAQMENDTGGLVEVTTEGLTLIWNGTNIPVESAQLGINGQVYFQTNWDHESAGNGELRIIALPGWPAGFGFVTTTGMDFIYVIDN